MGSEAYRVTKGFCARWRCLYYGRVCYRCESVAVFQRLCFLKHFNVLPPLESSVSKITNDPILPPSVSQVACFFEVDGNWCGNHEGGPETAKISHSELLVTPGPPSKLLFPCHRKIFFFILKHSEIFSWCCG